ncbi:hypothetical protein JCM8202_000735 [Rhodotorula sphaerocarpa]
MSQLGAVVAAAGHCVNRGFLRFERIVSRRLDRATRALGPVFVAVAVVLIATCAFAFFEANLPFVLRMQAGTDKYHEQAVFPERFHQPETPRWCKALAASWSGYVVFMFSFHYYTAVTTPAGSPVDPAPPRPPKQLPLLGRLFLRLVSPPERSLASASRELQSSDEDTAGSKELRPSERGHLVRRSPSYSPPTSTVEPGDRPSRYARSCKKCPLSPVTRSRPPKPERTHHCSVCQACVLKFDHHCPWIKGCVGLHNERSFVLFLVWFSIACLFAAWWGFAPAWKALYSTSSGVPWQHRTPRVVMLLCEVLAAIMGLAVAVMTLSQLLLVVRAQTNVESNDNDWYRKVAECRGRTYLNPYDLGWRENLGEFFNVGGAGARDRYHWSALLLPVDLPPSSDGWSWRKRRNWQRYAMDPREQLTDEELASDDEEVE